MILLEVSVPPVDVHDVLIRPILQSVVVVLVVVVAVLGVRSPAVVKTRLWLNPLCPGRQQQQQQTDRQTAAG